MQLTGGPWLVILGCAQHISLTAVRCTPTRSQALREARKSWAKEIERRHLRVETVSVELLED